MRYLMREDFVIDEEDERLDYQEDLRNGLLEPNELNDTDYSEYVAFMRQIEADYKSTPHVPYIPPTNKERWICSMNALRRMEVGIYGDSKNAHKKRAQIKRLESLMTEKELLEAFDAYHQKSD